MKAPPQKKTYGKNFGFSLLELMVVVVLIAGLMAITIPTMSSLLGVQIRSEVTKIAGLCAEVYNRASIKGTTHRIVFDLDTNSYWVEVKEENDSRISPELGYEERMRESIEKNKDDENVKNRFIPKFKKASGKLKEKFELERDIKFFSGWVEGMETIERSGRIAFYFFPDGYAQIAFISLASKEGEEAEFHLALKPLTGQALVDMGEPDINALQDEEYVAK